VRWHRSAEFERRSALYARLDGELYGHTRFFAAAALVNAVLAKWFELMPMVRFPHSIDFLDKAGAALETDNLAFARQIRRHIPGSPLDHALVCAEQARLQRFVLAHQARQPQRWESVRGEINELLNERYAAAFFFRWCTDGGRFTRVLREVREHIGMELNFATESHRIRIGVSLIEHIRREAPSDGHNPQSTSRRR
jgi:hypothetical protein